MAVRQTTSIVPAIGVFIGLLLLGFVGVIVVSPTAQDAARRLQVTGGSSFGYITSTRPPSSFDSSDSSSSSDISSEPLKSFESGSLQSSDSNQIGPKVAGLIGSSMGPGTLWLILQCLFAILYSKMVADPIKATQTLDERIAAKAGDNDSRDDGEGDDLGDFTNGFFECYKDRWVCLTTLCCPMVRMAHTNAVSGVCPFWDTLACYCCCSWVTLGLGPCCLVLLWRVQLKNMMKLGDNFLFDFLCTMLCPIISICQMSAEVDGAMGTRMTGCCEYVDTHEDMLNP